MKITIDCSQIPDRNTFHRVFAAKLRLPNFYGENLDALYDCLTSLPEKTTLNLLYVQALINNLGSYGRAAINAMEQAERENPRMLVINML